MGLGVYSQKPITTKKKRATLVLPLLVVCFESAPAAAEEEKAAERRINPRCVGTCSHTLRITKKEEGDTRCRPYSLFALKAPLRQRQRKDKRSAVNPH